MNATILAVVILALVGVGVIFLLLRNAARGRRAAEEVPPGMRPAYSDEQLERTVLERYMGWGLVLTLFFAIFLPAYWLFESSRLNAAQEGFFVSSVVRGEEDYGQYCAECHGADATGGGAASPYNPEESWPAPNLTNIVARYDENRNITDIRDFIITTIERGRPGTPMPTWGAAYGGSLTDQQVEDIADWILANQVEEVAPATAAAGVSGEELFQQNCVRCHGEDLQGRDVAPTLIGVFERKGRETVLGILRNGIYLSALTPMPPWQQGYTYPEAHYNDEALTKIVDYLEASQPEQLPEGAQQYKGPGHTLEDLRAGGGEAGPTEAPPTDT